MSTAATLSFSKWKQKFVRNHKGKRAAATAKGHLAMRAATRERMIRIIAKAGLAGGLSAILTLDYLRFARYTDTRGTDTVHFSSKVSDLFASQRICLSLWLCGGFHFFRLFATPPETVPSNFRMSPFFPTTQPRRASAKPIVLVSSSLICSQFFPRSIE